MTYLRLVPGRVAVGGRRQRLARGHREGPRGEVAVGRHRVGEVGLEDDDPGRALQRADALGRAAGGAGRVRERRRGRHGEQRLEAIHRRGEGRVRRSARPRPGAG